jgi:hypothetical protein
MAVKNFYISETERDMLVSYIQKAPQYESIINDLKAKIMELHTQNNDLIKIIAYLKVENRELKDITSSLEDNYSSNIPNA